MKPWSHDDKNEMSFAEQAVRLCTLKFCRKEEIPVVQKRQKRDCERAIDQYHFFFETRTH